MMSKIEQQVKFEVFAIWGENPSLARKMLRKLYMEQYDKLEDIEDKRLILYNLIVIESQFENLKNVKSYTKQLKEDMESVEDYEETDTYWYVRTLTYYMEAYDKELPKQEMKRLYLYCSEIYKEYEGNEAKKYLELLEGRFKLYLFDDFQRAMRQISNLNSIYSFSSRHCAGEYSMNLSSKIERKVFNLI